MYARGDELVRGSLSLAEGSHRGSTRRLIVQPAPCPSLLCCSHLGHVLAGRGRGKHRGWPGAVGKTRDGRARLELDRTWNVHLFTPTPFAATPWGAVLASLVPAALPPPVLPPSAGTLASAAQRATPLCSLRKQIAGRALRLAGLRGAGHKREALTLRVEQLMAWGVSPAAAASPLRRGETPPKGPQCIKATTLWTHHVTRAGARTAEV